SYGLFEYFNGLDLGVSALRLVKVKVAGESLEGVLAVDLARAHQQARLDTALDNLDAFGRRKPLAAFLLGPAQIADVPLPPSRNTTPEPTVAPAEHEARAETAA